MVNAYEKSIALIGMTKRKKSPYETLLILTQEPCKSSIFKIRWSY